MKSLHSLRIGALAAALVLAVPAVHAADTLLMRTSNVSASNRINQLNQTYDRFIITYRDGSTERSNSNMVLQNVKAAVSRAGLDRAAISSHGADVSPLSVSYQRKLAMGADLVRTSRKLSQSEANKLMLQISADPAVLHVQPDYRRQIVRDIAAPAALTEQVKAQLKAAPQTFTPNDPYYAKYQWHFWNAMGGANVNNAWDLADGTDITVAVLDTGLTEHSDLDMSLADAGYDFITDSLVSGRDTNGRVPGGWDTGDWTNTQPYLSECVGSTSPADGEPSSWHGTHVSGTAAELTNNGVGMAGMAYNAKVLPVRVLGHCGGYDSDIADAIEWASGGHVDGVPDNTHVAQVISMSLGGPNAVDDAGNVLPVTCADDSVMAEAISHANARGTTVVAAAGNDSADAGYFSPGGCAGVISVASNGITGKRAFYSNYGSTVTLAAPGGGIYQNDANGGQVANPEGFVWSTVNDGETTPTTEDYGGYAGTSQATPHVTGTVAMILSAAKAAGMATPTPAQIKDILVKSARPFPVAEDHPIGAGIVDAYAAVNLALGNDNGGGGGGDDETAIPLTKGALLSSQSGAAGSSILYSVTVPAGATTLNIRTLGGTGDVSLYVKADSAPTADGGDVDFKSVKPGNNEAVVLATPKAATYYIRVAAGQSDFQGVSVLADYQP